MLFYEEMRDKVNNSSKSNKKENTNLKINKNNPFQRKQNIGLKDLSSTNSQSIANMKKSKSFFLSKKLQELKNSPYFSKIQKKSTFEQNIKHTNNKQNKKFKYTFQNLYNNYPQPEPFPKKIDVRMVDSNCSNSNLIDINTRSRDNNNIYDDKKILFILINLGLENLFLKFKDNFITFNDLKFLTKDDFIEMKIPIGPRNRIIHFIEALKKNENELDFEELNICLEKYKKFLSGNKPKTRNIKSKYINEEDNKKDELINFSNKYICSKKLLNNSFIFSSKYESEKNENVSFNENCNDKNKNDIKYSNSIYSNNNNFNKINKNILENYCSFNNCNKIINSQKKKKFFRYNNFESENSKNDKTSEKEKINNINKNIIINQINNNNNFLNKKQKLKQYKKRNINENNKIENYKYKTSFLCNFKFKKYAHTTKNNSNSNISKYKDSIPVKIVSNNSVKDKNKSLSRRNTYTNVRNYNDSFHSNISCLSKNLLNKLDAINKEVEKYEDNYERLKKETKRRNKNVIKILSSNYFEFKNNPNFFKYNNSFNCIGKNITFFNDKDLENEKERNLKNELNNCNNE